MRAIVVERFGGLEALGLRDIPDLEAGPGEAVVRVRACAVNRSDLDIRKGKGRQLPPLPHILGRESAGDVLAVGEGVSGWRPGDRALVPVYLPCGHCAMCRSGRDNLCLAIKLPGVNRWGGYAETIAVPADSLLPIPEGIDYAQAASTLLAFSTAWHTLVVQGSLRVGESVLITGATGGVGTAGIQVARRAGATVLAATGSSDGPRGERLRELGADHLVDARREDFAREVLRLTDGRGVDLVLDSVGGQPFQQALACLALGGRLVTVGSHAGKDVPLDLVDLYKSELRLIGALRATTAELRQTMELLAKGLIQPVVDRVLPLSEAAEAHRLLESREHLGRVVLQP